MYLEGLENGIHQYKPGKEYRHDIALNNSVRYYFAISNKWRHFVNLGVGIGLANESRNVGIHPGDSDVEYIDFIYEIDRKTRYLYLNGFFSVGSAYKLSDRIKATASLSYMGLPKFRNKEEVSGYGSFDEHIFFLSVGIMSIIKSNDS